MRVFLSAARNSARSGILIGTVPDTIQVYPRIAVEVVLAGLDVVAGAAGADVALDNAVEVPACMLVFVVVKFVVLLFVVVVAVVVVVVVANVSHL